MDDLIRFYEANHVWILATAWFVLTAAFNLLTRFKTPEQWVEFGQNYPRLQNLIRLTRALGFDPVKAIKALGAFLSGKSEETKKDRPDIIKKLPPF